MNNILISGILSDGYGINPKKIWKLKIGEYHLKNGKKIKGIYIKTIISYMLSYTGGGKNECFPSIKTIANDLEISKDIIINAINATVEMGLITKVEMYPNDPMKHNNKYILTFLNSTESSHDVLLDRITTSAETTYDVVRIEQNNNIINNNKNSNTNVELKEILDLWNQQNIIKHEYKTVKTHFTTSLLSTLKQAPEQLRKAIINYGKIINSEGYYYTYRSTLWDFIKRKHYEKFDDDICFINFADKKNKPKEKEKDCWI